MEENNYTLIKVGVIAFVILVIFLILNPFVIVNRGERGVVMNWGAVSDNVMSEGFHLRIPIQQSVHMMDVKELKYETDSKSYSKDAQTVETKVAFTYVLQPDRVNKIYQEVGDKQTVETILIYPAIQESQKVVFAKFTAQDLLDKRAEVSSEISADLVNRLQNKGIILKTFSILNFDFSDAYEKAVEQKQVAAQDALKAENKLKQVQFEADQRVAQAEGEAKAIQAQLSAIAQQGGADYIKLKWIEAWSAGGAKVPTFVTGESGSSFLMNIGDIK